MQISLAFGCSKSPSDKKEKGANSAAPAAGSAAAAAGSGSGSDAPAEPVEAATVVGPTKSASGALEVTGEITGTFEWKKKDQKSPISCAWSAEKEIGGMRIDVSDGAGKLITLAIDVPPVDLGLPRLDVTSKSLAAPLKTSLGFNMSGDDEGNMTVKFDTKLGGDDTEAKPVDKKAGKRTEKPAVDNSKLRIKGTLEVSCPKKK